MLIASIQLRGRDRSIVLLLLLKCIIVSMILVPALKFATVPASHTKISSGNPRGLSTGIITASTPAAPLDIKAWGDCDCVALSWEVPSSNGGLPIDGYRIYRGTSTSLLQNVTMDVGNVTNWTDSGLTPFITYYYVVSAVNGAGEGVSSSVISATATASTPLIISLVYATICVIFIVVDLIVLIIRDARRRNH